MHFSIDRTVHTTAFDKPVVDHWLERKIAQTAAGSTEKDRSDDRPLQRRARSDIKYHRNKPVANHFNQAGHTIHNIRVKGLRLLFTDNARDRKDMESYLIEKTNRQ